MRLRAHRLDDVEAVLEQSLDPLSQRWTSIPAPYHREHAVGYVSGIVPTGWAEGSEWGFAIEVDGRFAGSCSLRSEGPGRAEVAYGAHPWVRGTGAVEQALRLLLRWGFTDRDLRTVVWYAFTGNWASRKVAWRLGFSFDGTIERWLPQRGDLLDAWVGSLRHDDPQEPRTPWLDCPVLEGDAVRLRPLRPDDLERVVQACADRRTSHWLGELPAPYTWEDARAFLRSQTELLATGTGIGWAVADRDSDELVGQVSLSHVRTGRDADLDGWTHPDARGRGVMAEATGLAARHGLDVLGLRRLRLATPADNAAARHVAEQQGARLVGVEHHGTVTREGLADRALYELVAGSSGAPEPS